MKGHNEIAGGFGADATALENAAGGWLPLPHGPQWPSLEHQIDLASARTCFVESGGGFPLVLVHGLMGYSFSWRKNIADLGKHFRVVALDLAGSGRSGPLKTGKYGVESWSRQLEEFLDSLGIGEAHVAATSAGGAVALDFASRCPHRVARLALIAPVTPLSRRAVFLAGMYTATGMPIPLVKLLIDMAPRLMPWIIRHRYYCNPARITPETIPGYLEGLRGEDTVRMLREAIVEWSPSLGRLQLPKIHSPVLLLWGARDKIIPSSCLPPLLEVLPAAAAVTIPDAGHLVYEELPGAFNHAMLRFFQTAPGPP